MPQVINHQQERQWSATRYYYDYPCWRTGAKEQFTTHCPVTSKELQGVCYRPYFSIFSKKDSLQKGQFTRVSSPYYFTLLPFIFFMWQNASLCLSAHIHQVLLLDTTTHTKFKLDTHMSNEKCE